MEVKNKISITQKVKQGQGPVYFLGIGGIGMSALARYFISMNRKVSGYDRVSTPLTKKLEATFGETESEASEPKKAEKGILQTVLDSSITKQVGRSLAREITRGILGVLGIGGNRKGKGLFG